VAGGGPTQGLNKQSKEYKKEKKTIKIKNKQQKTN
jgi:hypothetical protein